MTGMDTRLYAVPLVVLILVGSGCSTLRGPSSGTHDTATIVCSTEATMAEQLAAKEVRRFVYLRTGTLVPIVQSNGQATDGPPKVDLIVVGQKDQGIIKNLAAKDAALAASVGSLQAQQYLLRTINSPDRRLVLITGGDAVGTLYGAYRFAEKLGVRFFLHGDVIPDERIALELPNLDEHGEPLFELRGIQPFHDFPEGPDWWNTDDYKAIIGQLPKLRMNFIGLHTYPQGGAGPEPTVWIGLAEDVEADGSVKFSSPSSYQNTRRGNWGYSPKKTGDFSFGCDKLFERDDFGPEVMFGMMPWPQTPEQRNEVFNRTGKMLKEAFHYAQMLGVKTCVGTETPLIIPDVVKESVFSRTGKNPADPAVLRDVYRGMFRRIIKAYPLDYYWFWTPEDWTWGNPKDEQVESTLADLTAAIVAADDVKAPFTLATCGWVLGPPKDRALFDSFLPRKMPVSCINRNVGFSPVEPGFARAKERPKWAIPWLEDDPALIIPQLWAGRMRRDAADALGYGCTGLLGIHWRTRILGPNISALAQAAWEQSRWNPDFGKKSEPPDVKLAEGREGGNSANYPNNPIADTEHDPLYQTVIWDVKAYRLKVPNGTYTVRLQFCEPHYDAVGKRVFGVTLQAKKLIDQLDIFARVGKNRAMDYTFDGIEVSNGLLEVGFVPIVEFPCLAAFVVQGQGVTRRINCGGPAYGDYEADLAAVGIDSRPRDLPTDDFYADWALSQFGSEVAEPMAKLFVNLDGGPSVAVGTQQAKLPRPSTWVDGPGGINPDDRPWEQVAGDYAFVEEMAGLRPRVKGAGNLERFDYWLNNFHYLRAIGRLNCTWARFNAAMKKVKEQTDAGERKRLAVETALPLRKELVAQVADVHRHLLATVSTTGEMGTVANWQQHVLPSLLTEPGKELAQILGEDLPADALPTQARPTYGGQAYDGPARIIVPTVRSSLMSGEDLKLKVILLASDKLHSAFLHYRPMGHRRFETIPLEHIARCVYTVTIPAHRIGRDDVEYYIEAAMVDGAKVVFPATAPQINQTVVVTGPQ